MYREVNSACAKRSGGEIQGHWRVTLQDERVEEEGGEDTNDDNRSSTPARLRAHRKNTPAPYPRNVDRKRNISPLIFTIEVLMMYVTDFVISHLSRRFPSNAKIYAIHRWLAHFLCLFQLIPRYFENKNTQEICIEDRAHLRTRNTRPLPSTALDLRKTRQ